MSRIVYAGFRNPVEMGSGSEDYWSESKHGARISCTTDDGMWFYFRGVTPGVMATFDVAIPVTNIASLRYAKEAPPEPPVAEAPPEPPVADDPPTGPIAKRHQETRK